MAVVDYIDFDSVLDNPLGNKISVGLNLFNRAMDNINALDEKEGSKFRTSSNVTTVLVFSILTKIANGTSINNFTGDDWQEIAKNTSEGAILTSDENYSLWVFKMYKKYIDSSIDTISRLITSKQLSSLRSVSNDFGNLLNEFECRKITEVKFVEESMWICLEAMVKLLSASVTCLVSKTVTAFEGDTTTGENSSAELIADLVDAVSMYGLDYARYMMRSKEEALISEYINNQKILDEELKSKLKVYNEELDEKSKEFRELLDQAFNPDFREAFIASIRLAKEIGVNENDILKNTSEIDDFFLS